MRSVRRCLCAGGVPTQRDYDRTSSSTSRRSRRKRGEANLASSSIIVEDVCLPQHDGTTNAAGFSSNFSTKSADATAIPLKKLPRRAGLCLDLLQNETTGPLLQRALQAYSASWLSLLPTLTVYTRMATSPSLVTNEAISGAPPELGFSSRNTHLFVGCHEALVLQKSPVHGVGVFTLRDLKKGTRIVRAPSIKFFDSAQFLSLLGDSLHKLPLAVHYTHPTGMMREVIITGHARHFFNHSCAANVCSGISRTLWDDIAPTVPSSPTSQQQSCDSATQGLERGTPSQHNVSGLSGDAVLERMATFECFDDPNCFFVTRDVSAGEELFLDYHRRTAFLNSQERIIFSPTTAGVVWNGTRCECKSEACRLLLYPSFSQSSRKFASIAESVLAGGYEDDFAIVSTVAGVSASRGIDLLVGRRSGTAADSPWTLSYCGRKPSFLRAYRQLLTSLCQEGVR